MIEFGTCVLCAFMGAGVAILVQKSSLVRYFNLVECFWNSDITGINNRIDRLQKRIDMLENAQLSTNSVGKAVDKEHL